MDRDTGKRWRGSRSGERWERRGEERWRKRGVERGRDKVDEKCK
jgi:hypothetical protein